MSRGCQRGREVKTELMRTRAGAEDLANGRWSCGSAVAREGDEADGWGYPVSVPQREGRGEPDERDPLVSDHAERRAARAASAWAEREWAGLRACLAGPLPADFCFLFPFRVKNALHLKLCRKLVIDPKIMEIFV